MHTKVFNPLKRSWKFFDDKIVAVKEKSLGNTTKLHLKLKMEQKVGVTSEVTDVRLH